MSKVVLCIVGPTASGKTSLALHVARILDGEIISADSRQIYKHLDIGTAKPTPEERKKVKHYFIDEREPDQHFSAGEFGTRGREVVDSIFLRGKVPIVVGGSGLYVRSLIDGLFVGPAADDEILRGLSERMRREGVETLLEELQQVDPTSAAKMRPSNTRRIIRALEVFRVTGVPLSKLQAEKVEIGFTPFLVALDWDRRALYERINKRVEGMIRLGFLDEVRKLREMGFDDSLNALQTVGYQEAFSHLRGEVDFETMVELIKRNTRRFAKRQLTWFRSDKRIRWIPITDEGQLYAVTEKVAQLYRASLT